MAWEFEIESCRAHALVYLVMRLLLQYLNLRLKFSKYLKKLHVLVIKSRSMRWAGTCSTHERDENISWKI